MEHFLFSWSLLILTLSVQDDIKFQELKFSTLIDINESVLLQIKIPTPMSHGFHWYLIFANCIASIRTSACRILWTEMNKLSIYSVWSCTPSWIIKNLICEAYKCFDTIWYDYFVDLGFNLLVVNKLKNF